MLANFRVRFEKVYDSLDDLFRVQFENGDGHFLYCDSKHPVQVMNEVESMSYNNFLGDAVVEIYVSEPIDDFRPYARYDSQISTWVVGVTDDEKK